MVQNQVEQVDIGRLFFSGKIVRKFCCFSFCDLGLVKIRHSSYMSLAAPLQTKDIWVLFCLHPSKLMTRCDSNVGGRTRCYFTTCYLSTTAAPMTLAMCSFQSLIYCNQTLTIKFCIVRFFQRIGLLHVHR